MRVGRTGQSILCGLLSLAIAALLLLPEEHLHAREAGDGHQASVVHRHYAAHQTLPDRSASVDHPDGEPRWLSSALGSPARGAHINRIDILVRIPVALLPPTAPTGNGRFLPGLASAHGPPPANPPAPRGPPSSLL